MRLAPRHADGHFLLGAVAAAVNRVGDAAKLIARAIELSPAPPGEYHAQLARCLALLNREQEARAAAERALAAGPGEPLTLDTIGVVLARLGEHARAADAFALATARAPGNAAFQCNYAAALRMLGRFDEAREAYEAAVRAEPKLYGAHFALAEIDTQTPERNHVERLERLLAQTADDIDGHLLLCHALAKEHEDLGNFAAAFRYLEQGKARKRAALGYTFEHDRRVFEAVRTTCSAERLRESPPGHPSAEPIFVVGMPRTGTTLVERILSSHSAVASAGELQAFGLCVKRAAGTKSGKVLDPMTVEAAAGVDLPAVGEAYLRLARVTVGDARRFVDKMPLNFLYVGFIHAALPGARIVRLRRDPLDTCVSNYRQLFSTAFPYYRYSYSLSDIGRYYVSFERLMSHWDRVFPGKILTVDYEDLVRNQVAVTRRLLEFCGLPWQQSCVDFQRNPAAVATASAVQVREPLHPRSIGRWRDFSPQIDGLRAELRAAGMITAGQDAAPVGLSTDEQ